LHSQRRRWTVECNNGRYPEWSNNVPDASTSLRRYLTTEDVADLLRTTAETVRYWRHVGKGPASFKVGRRVLYDASDVELFIAAARSGAA
jgi:excisionase family DNA binding protein